MPPQIQNVNEQHVKIAKIFTWVISVIIFLMFMFAFYYFFGSLKSHTQDFMASHFGSYFAKSPEQILAIIRKDVIPSIVQVRCADDDSGVEKKIGSGIFYLDGTSSIPRVQTNAHVVLGSVDGLYHSCNIYFPRPADGTFYDSSYRGGEVFLYHDQMSLIDGIPIKGLDLAQLTIESAYNDEKEVSYPFPPKQSDVFATIQKVCKKDKQIGIGDKIYIIGYPNTGGDSITLTEGVVSGFSDDGENLIKISASTNHGNSGGIVIGQNDGCYYGIVESASFEKGSNLGFVMSSGFINKFIENMTGEKVYVLPATTTDAVSYLENDLKFLTMNIKYPLGWKVSTTSVDSEVPPVLVKAPKENALDDFEEGIILKAKSFDKKMKDIDVIKAQMGFVLEQLSKLGIADADTSKGQVKLFDGTTAYQILFFDKGGTMFSAPAYDLETFFVRAGKLYVLTAVAGNPTTLDNYLHIYDTMVQSIRF